MVHYPSYSESDEDSAVNDARPTSAGTIGFETPDEPQEVLHSLRKEMMQLWADPTIREVLRRKKIRLEEFPGLSDHFLN